MSQALLRVGFIGTFLFAAGCSGGFIKTSPGPVLPGQSPELLERPVRFRQQVRYRGPGARHSRTFNTVMEVRPGQVTLLVLSPLGSPAYRIVQENGERRTRQLAPFPLPVSPDRLFLDHQLVLWPRLELPDPYRYERKNGHRYVYRYDTRILTVQRPGIEGYEAKRGLENPGRGYGMTIRGVHVQFDLETHGSKSG